MATIKANCPACGPVTMAPREIDLQMPSRGNGVYRFTCPVCLTQVAKPANREIANLLMSGGVVAHMLAVPAEWYEVKRGPALTYDDLLDFSLALAGTDCLAELAANETARP